MFPLLFSTVTGFFLLVVMLNLVLHFFVETLGLNQALRMRSMSFSGVPMPFSGIPRRAVRTRPARYGAARAAQRLSSYPPDRLQVRLQPLFEDGHQHKTEMAIQIGVFTAFWEAQ